MTDRPRAAALVAAAAALLAVVAASGAVGAGAAGTQDDDAGAAATDGRIVRKWLSNERTLSRRAYPSRRAAIRTRPRDGARIIGQLRMRTEDELPNTCLLLKRGTTPNAGDRVRIRVPGRPSGGVVASTAPTRPA